MPLSLRAACSSGGGSAGAAAPPASSSNRYPSPPVRPIGPWLRSVNANGGSLIRDRSDPARAAPMRPPAHTPSDAPLRADAFARAIAAARRAYGGVIALSAVLNVFMLTGSLFMLQVYDRVLTSRSLPTLATL